LLPLVVDIRADAVRKRYEITLEDNEESIQLKAVPKWKLDQLWIEEIHVRLDPKTHLTCAVRTIGLGRHDEVVRVFNEQRVNEIAKDRDQLLHPDLVGFIDAEAVSTKLPKDSSDSVVQRRRRSIAVAIFCVKSRATARGRFAAFREVSRR